MDTAMDTIYTDIILDVIYNIHIMRHDIPF